MNLKMSGMIKSIFYIVILGLGGKICGLIRSMLVAKQFGASMELDSFLSAWTVTILITSLLGRAIANTIVLILNKFNDDYEKKINETNNLLNLIILVSIVITIIFWYGAPYLINVVSKGFIGEEYHLAISLLRIGLPAILIYNIAGVLRGYLNTEKSFIEYGLIYYTHNITVIVYVMFFATKYGINGLMVAQILGILSQILVQIPFLKYTKYKYKTYINIKDKNIKLMLMLAIPIFISAAMDNINLIVDKTMASELSVGSITALDYGNKINELFFTMLVIPITNVLLPILVSAADKKCFDKVGEIYNRTISFVYIIFIPVSSILIILSYPIVQVLFERGNFGATAVYMTNEVMIGYVVGMIFTAGVFIINNVYYALGNTRIPLFFSGIASVLNIIFNILFVKKIGLEGLAFSTSFTSGIIYLIMQYDIKKRIKYKMQLQEVKIFIISLLVTILMSWFCKKMYISSVLLNFNNIITIVGVGTMSVIVYIFIMILVLRKEIKSMLRVLRR